MRALIIGLQGGDVRKWQYFLHGKGHFNLVADGVFGRMTQLATMEFQRQHELVPDGVVGTFTYAKAGMMGFELVKNPVTENCDGLHWPPCPEFKALSPAIMRERFGHFSYQLKPEPNLQNEIQITCSWEKENLVYIPSPLLSQLPPFKARRLRVHKKVAAQFEKLLREWKLAGLSHCLLSYDGGYFPRMVRGSRNQLSAHCYGIAIDINAAWNELGAIPPRAGEKGSVRELVEIAHENGFFWGGHFQRKDGMHFEVAKIQ